LKEGGRQNEEEYITNGSQEVEFDILAIDFELRGTTAHGGYVSRCWESQDGFMRAVLLFFVLVILVVDWFCWWLL
jgi:hypothetical protein